jgi:hypothetical protein
VTFGLKTKRYSSFLCSTVNGIFTFLSFICIY